MRRSSQRSQQIGDARINGNGDKLTDQSTNNAMNAAIKITAMAMRVQRSGNAILAADPIKIGVVNEITGVQAQAGELSLSGIRLAQEEIGNAASTQPDALRSAVLAVNGYRGLEGTFEFDRNGAGLHGYNIVKYDGSRIVFMKRVDFPIW